MVHIDTFRGYVRGKDIPLYEEISASESLINLLRKNILILSSRGVWHVLYFTFMAWELKSFL